MIDIKLIRENPEKTVEEAKNKRITIDVAPIITADDERRQLQIKVQKLQEERNTQAKEVKGKPTEEQIAKGKELRAQLESLEKKLTEVQQTLDALLSQIPNPAKEDVKVGKDESENDVIRTYKEPTKFSFTPKNHLDLGVALDIIDVESASKVSGPRFAYLKNEGVLLEFALVQFALDILLKEGFTPVIPPVLIKTEVMKGLGYMENGGDEDMFHITKDGFTLVGTAEHALVPMYMNSTLQKAQLPLRLVGFSTAFRREAGSYGKDTKGILRVHQFDKVEMVSFVEEGKDDAEHDFLLSLEEKLFQMLDIPYQVIKMCTGDLGFPAARKFDIEAWMPGQNKYREVTSVSTVTDFQSKRLHIKYQDGQERKFVQILNGTAFAIGRTIIAILENYQTDSGSVKIPEVLQKYMGKSEITLQK